MPRAGDIARTWGVPRTRVDTPRPPVLSYSPASGTNTGTPGTSHSARCPHPQPTPEEVRMALTDAQQAELAAELAAIHEVHEKHHDDHDFVHILPAPRSLIAG